MATSTTATPAATEAQDKPYVLSLALDRCLVEELRGRARGEQRSLSGHVRFLIAQDLAAK